MTALRKVILAGKLGKQFGRVHHFAISTPAEAIKALTANYDDFPRSLIDGGDYRVIVDSQPIGTADEVANPFSNVVRIVPVVRGAGGRGLFGIIGGVALIGASFAFPATAAVAFAGTTVGSIAFGLGASLVLGGISQMLSPQPKVNGPSENAANEPSYVFNGPVNTTQQGQCVPVGYGRLIVGSAVISAGITADDYRAAGLA